MFDINFIIPIILIVFGLFIYIIIFKKLKPNNQTNNEFELFLKNVKNHMKENHPKIKIDYSIISKSENEKNIQLRETLIVENIIQQFFDYPYKKESQEMIPKDKLWANYMEKSVSNAKYPSDWQQRKELAWKRDNKYCNRCGDKITLDNTFSIFVKNIKDGGGYNFENIIILCSDCNKILNSTNTKNTLFSLALNDRLMLFVEKQN